ncbi:HupE/UreJ family protein [Rubritalea marina]|uniref:HupE/UreJ family protein n=1 Tax=Rubritalea marina TaxID=361055 RepID=UPI00037BCFD5|nr:HupE/UreJ family protein [Rubritalea marina]
MHSPLKRFILAFVSYCALILPTHAHVVEQLFLDFQADAERWEIELRFDAGYALPEMRANQQALQPKYEWLEAQSPAALERLKQETEKYIRECLSFGWETNPDQPPLVQPFSTKYPAWATTPPTFEQRFTDVGYAYYSVILKGVLPDEPGGLILSIADGDHPDFVLGYDLMGEDRVLTTFPGQSILIWNHEASVPPIQDSFYHFVLYGFRHVIPDGLDHVLFIAALCFIALQWRPLLAQSLIFTLGHSITLALVIIDWIPAPNAITGPWIEACIAATICYVAIENLRSTKVQLHRLLTVFLFGLIHGLGFASVLSAGIRNSNSVVLPLIAANLGVELGQVAVIASIFLLCFAIRNRTAYLWLRKGASLAIAAISGYWLIERVILALNSF